MAFHPEYAEYRRRVPMLLPFRRKANGSGNISPNLHGAKQ
jgi:hypothetical protein